MDEETVKKIEELEKRIKELEWKYEPMRVVGTDLDGRLICIREECAMSVSHDIGNPPVNLQAKLTKGKAPDGKKVKGG